MKLVLAVVWFFGFPLAWLSLDYFAMSNLKIDQEFKSIMWIVFLLAWLAKTYELFEAAGVTNENSGEEELCLLMLVSSLGETFTLRSTVVWKGIPEVGSLIALSSVNEDSKKFVKGEVKEVLAATKPLDEGESYIVTVVVDQEGFQTLQGELGWESFE